MAGLKTSVPALGHAKQKISPDEMDIYFKEVVLHPAVSTTFFGTVAPGTVAGPVVITNRYADNSRNVLFSIVGPAGGVGGTMVVYGRDQFGGTINETIAIASANGGGSASGSLIFAEVGTAQYYPNGVDNTGTPRLGVAIGTAAGVAHRFGILNKLGGTTDVKRITYINNGTSTCIASPQAQVDATGNYFSGTAVVQVTDSYVVLYKPTRDLSSQGLQANL